MKLQQYQKLWELIDLLSTKNFTAIRYRIAMDCKKESPFDEGEIELDESYFVANLVRGKRGRGASGKIPVFGMLKRNWKVYTQVIKNCSLKEILPIIQTKISNGMLVFTDYFKTYDVLADLGYKQHLRIKHSDNEFAYGENYINGIENFLGLCKVRLIRFRGVHKNNFTYTSKNVNGGTRIGVKIPIL